MDNLQFWTLVIAAGGFVTAIISLLLNMFLHSISRPKIKVTTSVVEIIPTPYGLAEGTPILMLEAVNLRSSPVTITQMSGMYPNKIKMIIFKSSIKGYGSMFPCQLKEGEVANIYLALPGGTSNNSENNSASVVNLKSIVAHDTTGRCWRSKRYPFRNVYFQGLKIT